MRNCPICDYNGKRVLFNDYEGQPWCLFECTHCEHRYLDSTNPHWTQADLDRFYVQSYHTDDFRYPQERLINLAEFIQSTHPIRVLDIGGMDGELRKRLNNLDVKCDIAGVGFKASIKYDLVVLSHTLEHVYNVSDMFNEIKASLESSGLLIIEGPIHNSVYRDIESYDYHWQHINKFRPEDLRDLFIRYRFNIIGFHALPDYREYKTWRIVGRNAGG